MYKYYGLDIFQNFWTNSHVRKNVLLDAHIYSFPRIINKKRWTIKTPTSSKVQLSGLFHDRDEVSVTVPGCNNSTTTKIISQVISFFFLKYLMSCIVTTKLLYGTTFPRRHHHCWIRIPRILEWLDKRKKNRACLNYSIWNVKLTIVTFNDKSTSYYCHFFLLS